MTSQPSHAALFVDFENIYYFIKNRGESNIDASDVAVSTIRALRISLLNDDNMQCIIQHAYADFERIGGVTQGALYLIGIETHNVLGTEHKNAADMRLCIDVIEILHTRREINTFVFVAGDRDYIPIVQRLLTHGKTVLIVSFKGSVSGDLLQVAEERNFYDATKFLPDGIKLGADQQVAVVPQKEMEKARDARPVPKERSQRSTFSSATRLQSDDERQALRTMLENFGNKPEIWMTPFLHKLREATPNLADYERKALISSLSERGCIAVEKRPGDPVDYTVLLVNWNHADVVELNPG